MSRLFEKFREMGPKAILVVLSCFMVVFAIVAGIVIGTVEAKQATESRLNTEQYRMEEAKREQAELERLDAIYQAVREQVDEIMPGFILLGDDLTAAVGSTGRIDYGLALQQKVSDELLNPFRFEDAVSSEFKRIVHTNEKRYALPVVQIERCGVSGESTATTLSMDGAYKIVLTEPVTVPAKCENVKISFQSERGDYIYPLIGGSKRSEAVALYDEATGTKIVGTLQPMTSTDPTEYLFMRSEKGEETTLPAGTRLVTKQSQENRNYFPIIWMGMNGGYDSVDDLIEQHIALLSDKSLYAEGYYLVVGLPNSTAAEEAAFEAAFGDHYLNTRKYLNEHGLEAAGITPTAVDLAVIPTGQIPVSLRDVNNPNRYPYTLNRAGYVAVGREIFRRIEALGYFDRVQEVLDFALYLVSTGQGVE